MMLTIELEPELEISLNSVAQQEHSSPNEIIRQLINDYIQRRQKSNAPKIQKTLQDDNLAISTANSLSFIDHLLSMPCDDGEFERMNVQLRDFE